MILTKLTRSSLMAFDIPNVQSNGFRCFVYNATKLWNCLPDHVKMSKTKDEFKYNCKRHLYNSI